MQEVIQMVLVILAIVAGLILINAKDRLLQIGILAGYFLMQFINLSFSSQWMISLTLLILGWMSCAVLGTGKAVRIIEEDKTSQSEILFKGLTYLFFMAAAFFLGQKSALLFYELNEYVAVFGIILFIGGLVQVAFAKPYYNIVFGLLIILAGFEVIYYSLETSLLVVGLLGGVKMGLAFIGSYWFLHYENNEETA